MNLPTVVFCVFLCLFIAVETAPLTHEEVVVDERVTLQPEECYSVELKGRPEFSYNISAAIEGFNNCLRISQGLYQKGTCLVSDVGDKCTVPGKGGITSKTDLCDSFEYVGSSMSRYAGFMCFQEEEDVYYFAMKSTCTDKPIDVDLKIIIGDLDPDMKSFCKGVKTVVKTVLIIIIVFVVVVVVGTIVGILLCCFCCQSCPLYKRRQKSQPLLSGNPAVDLKV